MKVLNITIFSLVFLFGFFIVSLKSSSALAVSYGWTCCTPYSGGDTNTDPNCGQPGKYPCAQNPSCNACGATETKNYGSCPAGDASCIAKECGRSSANDEKTVSNSCVLDSSSGSGNSASCRYASITPNKVTLKVNQMFVVKSNAFANGVTIGSMRAASSLTAVARVTPTFVNLCCEWSYGYRQTPVNTTVIADREGTAKVATTFYASSGSDSCFSTASVTVSGVADPLACIPGATCVSNTGSFAVGSRITCSMPQTTDLSLGTPNYQLRCTTHYSNNTDKVISKSSSNGKFSYFSIAKGVTNVDCKFRYCQTASNGVITCSNWGNVEE